MRISFGEDSLGGKNSSIQITNHWPNKTALQVEEKITKPWEQILKSISGYKKIESISEVGSSLIHLELEEGIETQNIIQTIRNEYLLQRQRFPEDSFFPRIKPGKSEDTYIVILQKIKAGSEKNSKELEQKIRNIPGFESLVHYSNKEKEILIQIHSDWIQTLEFPSLSQIFSTIRNYSWGFSLDQSGGAWFPKDIPIQSVNWSKLGIPSRFGEGLLLSSVGKVSLEERAVRHGTRINGLSSETMIVKAESNTSLHLLANELKKILLDYGDWIFLYNSHQEFNNDLFRFLVIFFSLDLGLIFFASYFMKGEKELVIYLTAYYTSLLIFLGICCIISYPIGKPILFLFTYWKYFLAVFPIKKIGRWMQKCIFSFFVFFLFVYWNWIPKSFCFILVCNLYFLVSISFLKILFDPFLSDSISNLGFRFLDSNFFLPQINIGQSKQSKTFIHWLMVLVFFLIGFVSSIHSSLSFYPLTISNGTIQMGRLEFPTSIPEEESLRITKQVEDTILNRKLTDLLVVKQNSSNADFYFDLNELGVRSGLNDLPTESGYFHILGESQTNSDRILRFSNADTEALEKSILPLIPWLRNFEGVSDVVLCFQPSTEGLELHSPGKFRSLFSYDYDTADSVRERSLDLQSAIVGKMLVDKKLTDIRFYVKQNKQVERYIDKPIKLTTGIPLFDKSISEYKNIKTPGRIYHKNGDTSLEVLVKGKNIQWDDLESNINNFLNKGPVKLSEILPQRDAETKYRPFFLFLWITSLLYRKKEKVRSFVSSILFLFLWRLQVSFVGAEYLLFGAVVLPLAFSILWVRSHSFDPKTIVPLILLFFVAYFFPGEGGKFFFGGLFLVLIFFLLQYKIIHRGDFFKTKPAF